MGIDRFPEINKAHKANFETLQRAVKAGDLTLFSAIRKADQAPVILLAAVQYDGKEYQITPLGMLLEGNPFEDYEPSTVGLEEDKA